MNLPFPQSILRCIVLVGCALCPAAAAQEPDTTALAAAPSDSLGQAPLHLMGFGDAASADSGIAWALSDSLPALRPDIHLAELLAVRPAVLPTCSIARLARRLESVRFVSQHPSAFVGGYSVHGYFYRASGLGPDPAAACCAAPVRSRRGFRAGAIAAVRRRSAAHGGHLLARRGGPPEHRRGPCSATPPGARGAPRSVPGAWGVRRARHEYSVSRSNLTRGRRSLLRVRYAQRAWSAEVLYMSQRRRVGAHGGVVIRPDDPNAIYQSDIAEVVLPEAERRIVRNDLAGVARVRWFSAGVTSATLYHSTEMFRYHDALDTLASDPYAPERIFASPCCTRPGAVLPCAWRRGRSMSPPGRCFRKPPSGALPCACM